MNKGDQITVEGIHVVVIRLTVNWEVGGWIDPQ